MKIIKVIVDEMPESCRDCKFERGGACGAFGFYPFIIILIERGNSKPSWCPLAFEHDDEVQP